VPTFHREHAVSHQQAQQQQQLPVARHFVSNSLTVSAPDCALHHHRPPRDCGFRATVAPADRTTRCHAGRGTLSGASNRLDRPAAATGDDRRRVVHSCRDSYRDGAPRLTDSLPISSRAAPIRSIR